MSLAPLAERLLRACRENGLALATAESCTGGMVSAALTGVAGASDVFDRGYVTYGNEAKAELLGVPIEHTRDPGAVSALVAREMAEGALPTRGVSLAITGIAGPGGGSAAKPVGLVFVAAARTGRDTMVEEHRFRDAEPDADRARVRQLAAEAALRLALLQAEAP